MAFLAVEVVGRERELKLRDRLCVFLGLRPDHDVEAPAAEGADLALLHPFGQQVRAERNHHVVPDGDEVLVEAAVLLLLGVPPLAVVEARVDAEAEGLLTLRIRREHRAARGVHVAEDRRDEQQGSGVVDAVEVVREALRREREGAGAFGVHAGRGHDVGGGHAGDLLGLFRGEGLAVGGKLFKAVAPLLDELAIVEAFLDENADHAHGKRAVGAHAGRQMDVGKLGGLRATGVDRDDLAAAGLGLDEGLPPAQRLCPDVRRHDHEGARLFGRHGARRRTAPGELLGLHAAGAAGGRRFVGPVHGAEMTGKTDDGRTRLLRVARIEHHAVSTVLLPDAQKIFRNHPVGFLPGAADESGILAALGIRALHRMEQTIRVVESLERRQPLRAEDVAGVLLPVFNRFDHVPACMELDAARRHVVAVVADRIAGPLPGGFGGSGNRNEHAGGRARNGKRTDRLEQIASVESESMGVIHGFTPFRSMKFKGLLYTSDRPGPGLRR